MHHPHARQFFRFCLVGMVGFSIDAIGLETLVSLGLTPQIARIFSMAAALQTAYMLHRRFTFHWPHSLRAWWRFMLTNAAGAGLNYLVFITLLSYLPIDNALLQRQVALIGGTGIALMLNYFVNRHFVFAEKRA